MPEILMPRLSDTMEEGTLSRWVKQEGDQVHKGDVVAEIETDKAVMELEAYDEGPLTRILVAEGATVAIGTPIAVIGGEPQAATGESSSEQGEQAEKPEQPEQPEQVDQAEQPERVDQAEQPEPAELREQPARAEQASAPRGVPSAPSEGVVSSPLARSLAAQHGISVADLTGSGPGGRVVRADVDAAISALDGRPDGNGLPTAPTPPAPPVRTVEQAVDHPVDDSDEAVPLSTIKRLTAQRMTQSAQQAPHFYLTAVVDAEALLSLRARINDRRGDAGPRISLNDLLVKACAAALRSHPQVNSSWDTTRVLRHRRVHVGIAVATDDGLLVPVVRNADRKTLTEIAREAHDLAERARARRLAPGDLAGGTFTISNLGGYGIEHFTAVINPPQAAILAVGAARPQPVVRDGELGVGTTMALTLSVDHRVLDGAVAADFLRALQRLLENPFDIVL